MSTNTKGYVNGASTLLFNQEVAGIELQVGGASTVVMKGSASRADIRVSGASAIKATEFDTEEMKIRCSGASGAHVHVTGKIDVSVSGHLTFMSKVDLNLPGLLQRGFFDQAFKL